MESKCCKHSTALSPADLKHVVVVMYTMKKLKRRCGVKTQGEKRKKGGGDGNLIINRVKRLKTHLLKGL